MSHPIFDGCLYDISRLAPGGVKTFPASFRQRSFTKWGAGFGPLVPGKYRVQAFRLRSGDWSQIVKGFAPGTLATGEVEIELAKRGDAWDRIATADASALVDLLADKDRQLRLAAVAFLTEKGKAAVPALIAGLSHQHSGVRAQCAEVLGALRQDARPAVNALSKALSDTDTNVGVKAAEALGLMGTAAKPAVPALVRVVKEDRSNAIPSVRPPAATALGRIGDARPDVVAALTEYLKEPMLRHDGNGYAAVAYALGNLGSAARGVAPVLVAHLQDKSNPRRGYALRALVSIGSGAAIAVPALILLLEDEQETIDMRTRAAFVLGRIGPAAKKALPALEKVRDANRAAPPDDLVAKAFLDRADWTIEAIPQAASR